MKSSDGHKAALQLHIKKSSQIFCQCNYHSNLVCNTTNLSVLLIESQCKDWKWASKDNPARINRNACTFYYKFLNPFQKHKTEHKRKLNSLKLSMVLFQLNLKSSNKHKINRDEQNNKNRGFLFGDFTLSWMMATLLISWHSHVFITPQLV